MSGESSQLGVRQRAGGGAVRTRSKSPASTQPEDETETKIQTQKNFSFGPYKKPSEKGYKIALALVTIIAFITRFWRINYPDQVVFDEVHFGKVRGSLTLSRLSSIG